MKPTTQRNQLNPVHHLLMYLKSVDKKILFLIAGCLIIDFGKGPFCNYYYPNNETDAIESGLYWVLWLKLNALFYPFIYFLGALVVPGKLFKLILRSAAGLSLADFIDRCFGEGSDVFWYDYLALIFIFIDICVLIYKQIREYGFRNR